MLAIFVNHSFAFTIDSELSMTIDVCVVDVSFYVVNYYVFTISVCYK